MRFFRLYIEKKTYFLILLFSSEEDMGTYARGLFALLDQQEQCPRDFRAVTIDWKPKAHKTKWGVEAAQILFCRKNLTPGLLAHELSHAIFCFLEQRGQRLTSKRVQETFCGLLDIAIQKSRSQLNRLEKQR